MPGEHEQSCKSHNRNLRHNNILDALISVARTVGVSANRDQVLSYMRSSPDDACKKQPDGVFHMYLASHLATLGGVTCCHPTTASACKSTYRSVGDVACGAEARKVVKYGPEAAQHQFHFVPLGCETYGAPGEGLAQFVSDLSAHAEAEGTADLRPLMGWSAPRVSNYAWQAMSVARMRGIAQALRRSAVRRVHARPSAPPMSAALLGADARVLGLRDVAAARPARPHRHGGPFPAGFASGSAASSSRCRVVASAASSSAGRQSLSSPAAALGPLASLAPLPLDAALDDVDFGSASPLSPPRHARVSPPLSRAVALFTLTVCVCMSVLVALALSRGPLRDSLPSFRGTLRASTSLGLDDVGFASKLAWDLVGYPLYIFLIVGLLLRVFSPQ